MDLYTVVLGIHIVSFVWNVFWVVVSDAIGLLWVIGKLRTAPAAFLHLTHKLVWLGLGTSILSGVYLFSTVSDYLLTVPAFYTKILLVLALLINAFFIGRHIDVAGERSFTVVSKKEKVKLFVSAAVSVMGWLGVFISAQLLGL